MVSRAVAMAMMTEAKTVDVEKEGYTLHSTVTCVVSDGAVSVGGGVVVSGGGGVVVSGHRGVVMMASCVVSIKSHLSN